VGNAGGAGRAGADSVDAPASGFLTRRAFLSATLAAPAAALLQSGATFIAAIPLGNPGGVPATPLERLLFSSLDARLFTDISTLSPDDPESMIVQNPRFYVRTAAPAGVKALPPAIPIRGRGQAPVALDRAAIERSSVRAGPYLMECAGNADPANFGLMSAAVWEGMPVGAALDRVKSTPGASRVLVTGIDDRGPSRTSVPGASWIFSRDELAGALLATRMNGAPLPLNHGLPVRLIVPGWYGCACIKWVDRIDLIPDRAPATTQMLEFASRTHQPFDAVEVGNSLRASFSRPASAKRLLARDFVPASIDTAAMPIRVEKWTANGRLFYRVVGIIWGGSTPTGALSIRFKSGGAWVRVDDCPLPASTLTWSLWSHTWRPTEPGRYQIVLRVDDPSIRTRRLDLFYYVRGVQIEEV
jgi:DMSO/TMAO reductase YedYZ molybdopterin-dependent catalytic subunit